MTERCDDEVIVARNYYAPFSLGTQGLALKRGPDGYSGWSMLMPVNGNSYIRWWCGPSDGNSFNPGTWRISNYLAGASCAGDWAQAGVDACSPLIPVRYSNPDDWTAERSSCGSISTRAIQARLGPDRLLEIRCLEYTSPPSGVAAVAGNAQVTLTWNPLPGSDSYAIYRSTSPGADTFYTSSATTPFIDTGLSNGTRYYYQVAARSQGLEGPRSLEVSATPSAPANLTYSAILQRQSSGTTGYAPFAYAGYFSSAVTLRQIQVVANQPYVYGVAFVRPGYATNDCGNPSAIVSVPVGGYLDLSLMFGTSTPSIVGAWGLAACVSADATVSQVWLNITYTP
jgi:hypothetical protein